LDNPKKAEKYQTRCQNVYEEPVSPSNVEVTPPCARLYWKETNPGSVPHVASPDPKRRNIGRRGDLAEKIQKKNCKPNAFLHRDCLAERCRGVQSRGRKAGGPDVKKRELASLGQTEKPRTNISSSFVIFDVDARVLRKKTASQEVFIDRRSRSKRKT